MLRGHLALHGHQLRLRNTLVGPVPLFCSADGLGTRSWPPRRHPLVHVGGVVSGSPHGGGGAVLM